MPASVFPADVPLPDEHELDDAMDGEPSQIDATGDADRGAFLSKFADLPSVVQARERLLERGYAEDDPIMVIIEALALYDKRQDVLTARVITAFANSINHEDELRGEVAALRSQMDDLVAALEDTQDHAATVGSQFGQILKSNAEYIPFLERAGREVNGAAALIENRSTTAVMLSYLAPAATLIAGLLIGLSFSH